MSEIIGEQCFDTNKICIKFGILVNYAFGWHTCTIATIHMIICGSLYITVGNLGRVCAIFNFKVQLYSPYGMYSDKGNI